MENLFDEMSKVLNKYVKHYLSDFEIDKKILLENHKKFYWFLRTSGTDLYDSDYILIKESEEFGSIDYYLSQSRVEAIYEVHVVSTQGDMVLGNMKKIPEKAFRELMKNARSGTDTDKFKMLLDYAEKPVWEVEGIETFKDYLLRKMKSYEISKDFMNMLLSKKTSEEIKSTIKFYLENGGSHAYR